LSIPSPAGPPTAAASKTGLRRAHPEQISMRMPEQTKQSTGRLQLKLQCLMNAFRASGRPVLFLVLLCVTLGLLFSLLGSEVGLILITAGLGALVLFILLGTTLGCRLQIK
ncbi:MAG: hypothetical protein OQK42_08460, partial [Sedimenticola sp.]|nr:hypothetical protein [Sedimenticola sp.]